MTNPLSPDTFTTLVTLPYFPTMNYCFQVQWSTNYSSFLSKACHSNTGYLLVFLVNFYGICLTILFIFSFVLCGTLVQATELGHIPKIKGCIILNISMYSSFYASLGNQETECCLFFFFKEKDHTCQRRVSHL